MKQFLVSGETQLENSEVQFICKQYRRDNRVMMNTLQSLVKVEILYVKRNTQLAQCMPVFVQS